MLETLNVGFVSPGHGLKSCAHILFCFHYIAITSLRAAESGFGARWKKIGSNKKGGRDKNIYTKAVRRTWSCKVTWDLSEGFNWYNIKWYNNNNNNNNNLEIQKHMQHSWDPGSDKLYWLPLPSPPVSKGNDFTNFKFLITQHYIQLQAVQSKAMWDMLPEHVT